MSSKFETSFATASDPNKFKEVSSALRMAVRQKIPTDEKLNDIKDAFLPLADNHTGERTLPDLLEDMIATVKKDFGNQAAIDLLAHEKLYSSGRPALTRTALNEVLVIANELKGTSEAADLLLSTMEKAPHHKKHSGKFVAGVVEFTKANISKLKRLGDHEKAARLYGSAAIIDQIIHSMEVTEASERFISTVSYMFHMDSAPDEENANLAMKLAREISEAAHEASIKAGIKGRLPLEEDAAYLLWAEHVAGCEKYASESIDIALNAARGTALEEEAIGKCLNIIKEYTAKNLQDDLEGLTTEGEARAKDFATLYEALAERKKPLRAPENDLERAAELTLALSNIAPESLQQDVLITWESCIEAIIKNGNTDQAADILETLTLESKVGSTAALAKTEAIEESVNIHNDPTGTINPFLHEKAQEQLMDVVENHLIPNQRFKEAGFIINKLLFNYYEIKDLRLARLTNRINDRTRYRACKQVPEVASKIALLPHFYTNLYRRALMAAKSIGPDYEQELLADALYVAGLLSVHTPRDAKAINLDIVRYCQPEPEQIGQLNGMIMNPGNDEYASHRNRALRGCFEEIDRLEEVCASLEDIVAERGEYSPEATNYKTCIYDAVQLADFIAKCAANNKVFREKAVQKWNHLIHLFLKSDLYLGGGHVECVLKQSEKGSKIFQSALTQAQKIRDEYLQRRNLANYRNNLTNAAHWALNVLEHTYPQKNNEDRLRAAEECLDIAELLRDLDPFMAKGLAESALEATQKRFGADTRKRAQNLLDTLERDKASKNSATNNAFTAAHADRPATQEGERALVATAAGDKHEPHQQP